MSKPAETSRWAVVCPAYVSHHPDQKSAQEYAKGINGLLCKHKHAVLFCNLPKGSRLTEETK